MNWKQIGKHIAINCVYASAGVFVVVTVLGLLVPEAKEQQKEAEEGVVAVKAEPAMFLIIAEDGTVSGIRRFEGVVKNPLKLDQATLDSIIGLTREAVAGEGVITEDIPSTSIPTGTQSRILLPLVVDDSGNVSGSWKLEGSDVKVPETDLVIEITITKDGRVTGTCEEKVSSKISPVVDVDDGTEELEWVPIPQKKPEPKPAVTHAPDPKPEPKTYSTHPERPRKARRMFVPQTYLLWHPNYPPPNQPNRFPGRYFKY